MKYTYSFYKEDQKWHIGFPAYIAQGGSKSDLLMVAGADMGLIVISGE
jgi:hypothetical protein